MAACTEVEEKSSDESSHSLVNASDPTICISSGSRCNSTRNSDGVKELGAQLLVESSTGDLKDLSDDEFHNLLKEASTFNKPNNQESILLKQLRKEVAESDSCENVGRSETSCVSKRVDRKCSKVPSSSSCLENSGIENSPLLKNNPSTLPARTLNKSIQKKSDKLKEISTPVLLSFTEKSISDITEAPLQFRDDPSPVSRCVNSGSNYANLNSSSIVDSDCDSSMVKQENQLGATLVVTNGDDFMSDKKLKNLISNNSLDKTPQEFELMELKRSKDQDSKNEMSASTRRTGGGELSNSKFYVNCDVDTTVTFPIKLVTSSVDDRGGGIICDAMGDSFKKQVGFPCFSWQRNNQQVHSFLGSVPVDHEALQSQNDSDGGGNPFARASRQTNIASFVSATLMDYSGSSIIADNQPKDYNHRKHKRTRNNGENGNFILAENIAGHRGNEDIDALVQFIENDKKDKALTRSTNSNQIIKNIPGQDALKRKVNVKENKLNTNKNGGCPKKKSVEDNAVTVISKPFGLNFDKTLSSESESSDDSIYHNATNKLVSTELIDNSQYLDINSNIMENVASSIDTASDKEIQDVVNEKVDTSSVRSVSPDVSSFATDYYSVSESLCQPVEESGFRIVKKKQRKRHQGKRSENYHWHYRVRQSTSGDREYYGKEPAQHSNGIMLLSNMTPRNQCGKQDSRRKSTSSVPHSDQSSVDNSDLDSVHSLPVRGSAPHPTKTHPHTTPSSSSSTPQASYADIARMPVSKQSSMSSVSTKPINTAEKAQPELTTDELQYSESDSSTPKTSEPCAIKNIKSTREINTQTEPVVLTVDVTPSSSDSVPITINEKKTCSSSVVEEKKTCLDHNNGGKNCSNKVSLIKLETERSQRPAVVMMGNIPLMETSGISFGIDLKEILQISLNENADLDDSGVASHSSLDAASVEQQQQGDESYSDDQPTSDSSKSSFDDSNSSKCDVNDNISTFKLNASSPCSKFQLNSGQRLQFAEELIDTQKFNYMQIVNLFAQEWKNVQNELSETSKTDDKIKYYEENC